MKDRSSGPPLAWAAIGAVVGLALLFAQAAAQGGWAGLLSVGEASPLRPLIEEQLGAVPLDPNLGHDGQVFYAIGLDLTGSSVPELLDHPGYRYRRILYPALSSVGGVLDGHGLLTGMIVVALGGFTAAVYGAVTMHPPETRKLLSAAGVLLNPGVWIGLWILAADAMALGLSVMAISLYLKGSRWMPILLLSAAALTKDTYLLAAFGLAGYTWASDRRYAAQLALFPVAALAAWTALIGWAIGDVTSGTGNLSLPFVGLAQAAPVWGVLPGREVALAMVTLVIVVVAPIAAIWSGQRRRLWLWLAVPWTVLALSSSSWVWNLGNNAARSFAMSGAVLALALSDVLLTRQGRTQAG